MFVKIRTACGIEGVGEAYAATFSPHVIAAMAEDLFERVFAGQDPMQIETLWRKAYGAGFTLRPDVSLMGVLSALEMACWDITGKALEQPIYKLLGGLVNPRLRSLHLPVPGRERGRVVLRRPGPVGRTRSGLCASRVSRPSSSIRSAVIRCSTRASPRSSAWTCRNVSAN